MIIRKIAEADKPNKNGIMFPKHILQQIVTDYKDKEILGHLGETGDQGIHLSMVSHRVNNLRMSGPKMYGDIDVLHTPPGQLLNQSIDDVVFQLSGSITSYTQHPDNTMTIEGFTLHSINAVVKEG